MKFQITFAPAAPIQQRACEYFARQLPMLGRDDLMLTWSELGELLTLSDLEGNVLAKAPCPPLSDSDVPLEIKTASVFSWLRSVLEMVRK